MKRSALRQCGLPILLAVAWALPACDPSGPAEEASIYGGLVYQSGETMNAFFADAGWIYTARDDGTVPTRRVEGGTPAWSPDGRRIAFANEAWVGAGQSDIFLLDLDTEQVTRLTETSEHDWRPRWSPEGSRISFNRCPPSGGCRPHIMNADGTVVRGVQGHPWDATDLAWSPDGLRWAYSVDRDGDYEIFLSDTVGSNEVRLTDNSVDDRWPAWSPDGTRIAIHTLGIDGYASAYPGIFVMGADGSDLLMLSEPRRDTVKVDPAWSADGREILFASRPNRGTVFELLSVSADGTGTVRRLGPGRSPHAVQASARTP